MAYRQYLYTTQRTTEEKLSLIPPLRPVTHLCMKDVAYIPSISNGYILVPLSKGILRCYEQKSFSLLWELPLAKRISYMGNEYGQVVVINDKVLVRGEKGLYTLNLRDGEVLMLSPIDEIALNNSVLNDSSIVGLFNDRENVKKYYYGCFDYNEGRMIWEHAFDEGDYDYPLTGTDDSLVVYDREDQMACLDLRTGAELWRRAIPDLVRQSGVKPMDEKYWITGAPMISRGRLVQPIGEHHIACLDLATGKTRWSCYVDIRFPDTSALYPDGKIYMLDTEFYIELDLETGRELRKHEFGRDFFPGGYIDPSSIAVSDTTVYFSDKRKGRVIALDKKSLHISWTCDVNAEIGVLPPVITDGLMFILDKEGGFHAFEEDRG